jgi:hypothetical protein
MSDRITGHYGSGYDFLQGGRAPITVAVTGRDEPVNAWTLTG